MMLVLLLAVLSVLLCGIYAPGKVLFSNDGPLGRLMSQCHRLPDRFTGCWGDLNGIGMREEAAPPNVSFGLQWLLGPAGFSKFYVPLALLILGLGAWYFFRQAGLAPPACILGGLAATLNSCFFSTACWGVAADAITFGMSFVALALLVDSASDGRWRRVGLAGLAVGMAVSEGADVGALFSLLVAAFIIYRSWVEQGSLEKNLATGLVRLGLVGICAALLAAQAISELVATNVEGVAGAQQDEQTKQKRWDWATQWSLPKREILGLAVPGLFGYRMASPGGGGYWGRIGRDAAWDHYYTNGQQGPPPEGYRRFSGGGFYAGVIVLVLACWAAAQSLRSNDSIFSRSQRRWVWFWLGLGLFSVPLAFGRFAPFYRWVYGLPYVSTIRNPVKFLYVLSFALVVLFAYGVDGLGRRYMASGRAGVGPRWEGLRKWWANAHGFERRWVQGCLTVLCSSLVAWLVYASCRHSLEQYLLSVQIGEDDVQQVAAFSIRQVGWFIGFFMLGASLLALIFSGAFAGRKAGLGSVMLGVLVVVDLGRANLPWIIYWDSQEKYASNPIIDVLRQEPFEHRVALLPSPVQEPAREPDALLGVLYRIEWLQHVLPYYNVQSLDVVQMPRKPWDLAAFDSVLNPPGEIERLRVLARRWQLTNTRYLLGSAGVQELLYKANPQLRLQVAQRFAIVPKPGISVVTRGEQLTAAPVPSGSFALFEFTGALPRAKLYDSWQIHSNDQATLKQLASSAFDPERSVFVAGQLPAASAGANTNENAGTAEFTRYAPRDIALKCAAWRPSVLLLNDRFDPNWKVLVDGKVAPLLRCNFIMRGVYLAAGSHRVEFKFQPPEGPLFISLAANGAGVLVLGSLLAERRRSCWRAPAAARRPGQKKAATERRAGKQRVSQ